MAYKKFNEIPVSTIFQLNGRMWTKMSEDGELLSNDYRRINKSDPVFARGYCQPDVMVEVIEPLPEIPKSEDDHGV